MATTVEDLISRLGPIGEAYRRESRDDLVSDVLEAERTLGGAVRRLRRLAEAAA